MTGRAVLYFGLGQGKKIFT